MIDEQSAWNAVQQRDRTQDGRFFFAVTSTGIYCRPSCPARRPLRTNVRFFQTTADAVRGGFRACRRCEPDGEHSRDGLVRQVVAAISEALHEDQAPTLASLAASVGVSPFHLQRVFKQETGVSPRAYAATMKLQKLQNQLKSGAKVTDAIYEAGYGSSARAYADAETRLGMTPGQYRKGGRTMTIRHAAASTHAGIVMVGLTERGVCSIALGEDTTTLLDRLREEFPGAEIIPADDGEMNAALATIVACIDEGKPAADLPLEMRGTAFQARVWDALRAIPRGETRTYGQVAESIGRPSATRAVARACASNRLAVVIPCHRVIRSDGGTAGYRWGAERKKVLLAREEGK